jgi:hypothetical protein
VKTFILWIIYFLQLVFRVAQWLRYSNSSHLQSILFLLGAKLFIFMDCYPLCQNTVLNLQSIVVTVAVQVRLFAAEDAPDLSGTAHQDLLQAKQTKFMHTTVPISSSDLPPGFGLTIPISIKPAVADVIPEVPWHAPALFNLHPSWRVIAGGESKEVAVQRQRELRVLEAVYPRASSIPERYNFPVF